MSSSNPPATATKRLLHELNLYAQSKSHAGAPSSSPSQRDLINDILVHLGPVSDAQLHRWEAIMRGAPHSPYEGGLWKLDISIPDAYPMAPPELRFVTTICHPNVNIKTGEICLDLLKSSWSPAYTISQTLAAVHQLLTDPEPESPLNVDVAALLRAGDKIGAESLVRFYTQEYRWER